MIDEILKEKIIRRDIYVNKLFAYMNSNVIKVLTWMRRVGKSFMLKTIIQDLVARKEIKKQNIFYVNKELLRFDHIKNYKDLDTEFQLFLQGVIPDEKIFIGIDEVQDIEEWEKFVNSYLATYQHTVEIFITWSNSTMLSSELSSHLTWRYIELEVFPLDLDEYALFSQKDISKELFLDYLKYGWLPGIFAMNQDETVIFNYLNGIYATILLKDIVKYFGLRNIDFFENLYKYIFSNIWNVISSKSISDYLKSQKLDISPETILNYIGYWLNVYMLHMVKSVNPDTKKYFEIYNKYYVTDLGLRNSLVWFDLKKDIWKLIENYVFLELKRHWYDVKIWRLSSEREIDFIAEKHWVTKYFQVCYLLWWEDTIAREYGALKGIHDNWEKYVVSFDDIDFGVSDGIRHIHVMKLAEVL
jgi:predicted AAA+ superfamily ATPase